MLGKHSNYCTIDLAPDLDILEDIYSFSEIYPHHFFHLLKKGYIWDKAPEKQTNLKNVESNRFKILISPKQGYNLKFMHFWYSCIGEIILEITEVEITPKIWFSLKARKEHKLNGTIVSRSVQSATLSKHSNKWNTYYGKNITSFQGSFINRKQCKSGIHDYRENFRLKIEGSRHFGVSFNI